MKNYWPVGVHVFFASLNILLRKYSDNPKIKSDNLIATAIYQAFFAVFLFVLCYYNHTKWAWFFVLLPLIFFSFIIIAALTAGITKKLSEKK